MKVLVLGAGGHGQCVADALLRSRKQGGDLELLGFLDDVKPQEADFFAGFPILGRIADMEAFPNAAIVIAVGDNEPRERLFEETGRLGRVRVTVVDPTAIVGSEVDVGEGSYIGPLAILGPGSQIGSNVIVNGGGCLGHHSLVGDHVHIGPGVVTARGVSIGERAMIGAGTVIKPECSIGRHSEVGAGSVVSRDVAEYVVAAGAPARPVRRRDS